MASTPTISCSYIACSVSLANGVCSTILRSPFGNCSKIVSPPSGETKIGGLFFFTNLFLRLNLLFFVLASVVVFDVPPEAGGHPVKFLLALGVSSE